jgi:hypothetical protein
MTPETDAPYARAAQLLREARTHLCQAKDLIFDVAVIHEEEPIEDPEHAAILRSKASGIAAYSHVLKALEISCDRDSHLFGEAPAANKEKTRKPEPRPDLVMLCQAVFGQRPCQLPAEHKGPHRAVFGPDSKSWIEWLSDETGVAARLVPADLVPDLDSIQIPQAEATVEHPALTLMGCVACPGLTFEDADTLERHIRMFHPSESLQEVAQP